MYLHSYTYTHLAKTAHSMNGIKSTAWEDTQGVTPQISPTAHPHPVSRHGYLGEKQKQQHISYELPLVWFQLYREQLVRHSLHPVHHTLYSLIVLPSPHYICECFMSLFLFLTSTTRSGNDFLSCVKKTPLFYILLSNCLMF